jgi:hypothetical protein
MGLPRRGLGIELGQVETGEIGGYVLGTAVVVPGIDRIPIAVGEIPVLGERGPRDIVTAVVGWQIDPVGLVVCRDYDAAAGSSSSINDAQSSLKFRCIAGFPPMIAIMPGKPLLLCLFTTSLTVQTLGVTSADGFYFHLESGEDEPQQLVFTVQDLNLPSG